MLKHKDHFHGSDLEKIEAIYHIKKEDIISFSANESIPIKVSLIPFSSQSNLNVRSSAGDILEEVWQYTISAIS